MHGLSWKNATSHFPFSHPKCLRASHLCAAVLSSGRLLNVAPDAALAANLANDDLHAELGINVDLDLDLGALLDALERGLGEGGAGLPDLGANLLGLVVRVDVAVVVLVAALLVAVGLGLGLGLLDLDLADALGDLDEHVAALARGGNLGGAPDGHGRLGVDERAEDTVLGGLGDAEDADGLGQVGGKSDHGVGALLDVLGLELLDQGSLDGGTTGRQLGGVDGAGRGGGGENGGALGESALDATGNLGGVAGTASKDDLVNVKNIELSLLDSVGDQAGKAGNVLVGQQLIAGAVDGGGEVNAISQALDAEVGRLTNAESLLDGLRLKLQLGKAAVILAGVGLVLLDELLGEVVHENLIELSASNLVVVSSS